MNGNRTAEQLLGEAVQQARMAASSAHKTQTTAIEFHQTLLRVNTSLEQVVSEQREFRKEMNDAISELTSWIARVERSRAQSMPTINDDDWAETPTGHGIHLKMTKTEFEDKFAMLMKDKQRRDDARKWRMLWKKSKTGVYLVGAGALTLSGERLVQWFLAVLSHVRLH